MSYDNSKSPADDDNDTQKPATISQLDGYSNHHEFAVKSWEKSFERLAHIEKLFGMMYIMFFTFLYYLVKHQSASINILPSQTDLLNIIVLIFFSVISGHLGNLIIACGLVIYDIEDELCDKGLFAFSKSNKYLGCVFPYSLLFLFSGVTIISAIMIHVIVNNVCFSIPIAILLISIFLGIVDIRRLHARMAKRTVK